eukprot:PhM_4_TR16996/c0_g1_i1/m.97457/K03347/CUL1, CDC53; cullin 1
MLSSLSAAAQEEATRTCQLVEEHFNRFVQYVESNYNDNNNNNNNNSNNALGNKMAVYTLVYNHCTSTVFESQPISTLPGFSPMGPAGSSTGASQDNIPLDIMYDLYSQMLETYLQKRVILPANCGNKKDALLHSVVHRWKNHKIISRWLERMFAYLDRYYITHARRPTLRLCALTHFKEVIFARVSAELRDAILDNIRRDRVGERIDRLAVQYAVGLLHEMEAYDGVFEDTYVAHTTEHYTAEAAGWIASDSTPSYLAKAEDKLNEERGRCAAIDMQKSEARVIAAVQDVVLVPHQRRLLDMEGCGFIAMLRDHRVDDIHRVHRLYADVSKGLDPIAAMLKEYTSSEGLEIVRNHTRDIAEVDVRGYVKDFLNLHTKYTELLATTLNSAIFRRAVKDGFEHCVNQPLTVTSSSAEDASGILTSAELLAMFTDSVIRNVGFEEKLTDNEMDATLDKVVDFLSFITDQDIFLECYRKHLSKRLMGASSRDDTERSFVAKLKLRYGAPFTSRLEGMLQDRSNNEELMSAFRAWQQNRTADSAGDAVAPSVDRSVLPTAEFTCQVLTQGFWPMLQVDNNVVVPGWVQTMMKTFGTFYDSRTQSRVLTWIHHLGTASLVGNFQKGTKDIMMTAYQACVLLTFNNTTSNGSGITGQELVSQLGIEADEIKKALVSLSMSKFKVLTRVGERTTGDVRDTDVFVVNDDFTCPVRKFRVPNVVAKVNIKQSQELREQVQEDRRHPIEACIVRVMKARQTCEHQMLISECITLLSRHFRPDPRVIKKRVEDLITREYLERHPDKPSWYRYVTH